MKSCTAVVFLLLMTGHVALSESLTEGQQRRLKERIALIDRMLTRGEAFLRKRREQIDAIDPGTTNRNERQHRHDLLIEWKYDEPIARESIRSLRHLKAYLELKRDGMLAADPSVKLTDELRMHLVSQTLLLWVERDDWQSRYSRIILRVSDDLKGILEASSLDVGLPVHTEAEFVLGQDVKVYVSEVRAITGDKILVRIATYTSPLGAANHVVIFRKTQTEWHLEIDAVTERA